MSEQPAEFSPNTFAPRYPTRFTEAAWNAEDLGLKLVALAMIQADWSQRTFGSDASKGPLGSLKHLMREVVEAICAPDDEEEYADCFLLVIEAARRAGISINALVDAAQFKQGKNLVRKWGPPDSAGVVSHIQEGGS